jgi:glycine oxidase
MLSTSETRKPRIAVVGGGLTGAFAAYFLARLGAEPTIIERDPIPGGASVHNPGGLNPLHGPGIPGPMQALALESLRLHVENWAEIARLSGVDFGAGFVSRIFVAMNDREAAQLAADEELYRSTPGFSARVLSRKDLRRLEPRLTPDASAGMLGEGNARVDAGPYTRAVARAAGRLGAKELTARACDLRHSGGRVSAVVLDSGTVQCDGVVIASGPWCEAPARWLGVPLAVEPVKGELLLAQPQAERLSTDITWGLIGAYQAGDDRLWLGGTEERAGFGVAPSASARTRILEGIHRLIPKLGPLRVIRHVAGLRPVTPDGLPIVGIPEGWANVCLAVGAGRKGVLLSAGLGRAAAELLVTGNTGAAIQGCAPGRAALAR